MQLRILLLINPADLRSRVTRVLRDVDAFVRAPADDSVAWSTTGLVLSDVLIVSRDLLPAPPPDPVRTLTRSPNAPAIVVLESRDDPIGAAALRAAGAEAVLVTAISDELLGQAIRTIAEKRRTLLSQTVAARRATPRPALSDFVSVSPAMQRFLKTVHRVADSDAPLLITGETGVGKERLARAMHHDSRRADGPFISVNCGAIPENLLESQLFGHEKGAFTGATRTQRGCFELAHGGTLFLDEISEMPFHLQVKLLHVLQDYEVVPVGGEKRIPVDVRVVAATNREIRTEVEAGRFRNDLYYRLGVVTVEVPPLRQRTGDIPSLADSILEGLSARTGRRVDGIAPAATECLCNYAWPGNVRELINVLERALLLCDHSDVRPEDLPEEIALGGNATHTDGLPGDPDLIPDEWMDQPLQDLRDAAVARFEKAYLTKLLTRTRGQVGQAARRAGIEPRTLFNKMRRYGLRKEDFRGDV